MLKMQRFEKNSVLVYSNYMDTLKQFAHNIQFMSISQNGEIYYDHKNNTQNLLYALINVENDCANMIEENNINMQLVKLGSILSHLKMLFDLIVRFDNSSNLFCSIIDDSQEELKDLLLSYKLTELFQIIIKAYRTIIMENYPK